MSQKRRKSYTPKFKFQVVLEALRSERSEAEVARAYQVHPVTQSKWKKQFLEKGSEVFTGKESDREYEKRIAELERLVGRKELEMALLRNFMEGS